MNSTISFFTPVKADIGAVETLMRAQTEGYHADLQAALDLILKSGGKRIRPNMTLLIGQMLGADKNRTITLSAAIELLHTATLVHDDLIDSALLRRGMPTLNSQWSPGATVLTGDFLFARAAQLAAETESIPVMKIFSRTLGIIVNGEIAQMFASRCVANHENYIQRIYAKTASLFETAAAAAGLISPVQEEIVEQMRVYGYEIGMAFQIIDDILDFTGEQATVGKPVGSDLRQGLITLPALFFLDEHSESETAQLLLSGKCPGLDQMEDLITNVRNSNAIQMAHKTAVRYVERGLAALSVFPESAERQALIELANYIVERDF